MLLRPTSSPCPTASAAKITGTSHLEEEIANLREEIAALTVSHQVQQELALSQHRTPLGAAAHIVDEYCRLFGHGAPVRLASFQWFLNAVMNDNVRFGKFLDVELLLNQWERYSLYHAAIEWTMKSLSVAQLAEPRVVTVDNQYDDGPLVVSIKADLRSHVVR